MFIFKDPATPEIYTLSLHDALPISRAPGGHGPRKKGGRVAPLFARDGRKGGPPDRKSTRLNSSHVKISYAVFCLKKKKMPQTRNCVLARHPRTQFAVIHLVNDA